MIINKYLTKIQRYKPEFILSTLKDGLSQVQRQEITYSWLYNYYSATCNLSIHFDS